MTKVEKVIGTGDVGVSGVGSYFTGLARKIWMWFSQNDRLFWGRSQDSSAVFARYADEIVDRARTRGRQRRTKPIEVAERIAEREARRADFFSRSPVDDVPAAMKNGGDPEISPTVRELDSTAEAAFMRGDDIPNAILDKGRDKVANAGLPPPRTPPGLQGKGGASPEDSAGALNELLKNLGQGLKVTKEAVRKFSGARSLTAQDAQSFLDQANGLLKKGGIIFDADGRITDAGSINKMKQLLLALAGERDRAPDGLGQAYTWIRGFADQEEADLKMFDPALFDSFKVKEYFARMFRFDKSQVGEGGPGPGLGSTPWFLMERNKFTLQEMFDFGYEYVSWNPAEIAVLRRLDGVMYREQHNLVRTLHAHGLVKTAREVADAGLGTKFRTPDVPGPAFKGGRPYKASNGQVQQTPRLVVPNKVAQRIENLYGKDPELEVAGKNIVPYINSFATGAKHFKLFGSLFQHIDFARRNLGVAAASVSLGQNPGKVVPLLYRMVEASVSQGRRAKTRLDILSGRKLYDDFDINLRMVLEKGWNWEDASMFKRSLLRSIDVAVQDPPRGMVATVKDRVGKVKNFIEDGLFDGVYRESQAYALENFIIPSIRRAHPDWDAGRVAALAAEEVNKMYSTLGPWQTAIQGRALRFGARMAMFSPNETESWIRAGASMFKGPNKRMWLEYHMGYFISAFLLAEGINIAVTGDPLPPKALVPVWGSQPGAMLPGGFDWNSRFLSPQLPFKGRNGEDIYLDMIDQGDTSFRWVLNPIMAASSRLNLFPGAARNQLQGSDFYGRPLEGPGDRGRQVIEDVFAPIGLGNAQDIAREKAPALKRFLPPKEDRIGVNGSPLQMTGLNVRAIQTEDMIDKWSHRMFGRPFDELEPHEKKIIDDLPHMAREMSARHETALIRDSDYAVKQERLNQLEAKRIETQKDLETQRKRGVIEGEDYVRGLLHVQLEYQAARAALDPDYLNWLNSQELPTDPNKLALVQFYQASVNAKRGVVFDNETYQNELDELRETWTSEQRAYVERNSGLREDDAAAKHYYHLRHDRYKYYWDAARKVLPQKEYRDLWYEYDKIVAGSAEREAWRIAFPWLKKVEKVINDVKEELRVMDPGLDAFVVSYYDSSPVHPVNSTRDRWHQLSPSKAMATQKARIGFGSGLAAPPDGF